MVRFPLVPDELPISRSPAFVPGFGLVKVYVDPLCNSMMSSLSTAVRVQSLALAALLFARTIASRREQPLEGGVEVNSSSVVVTVIVSPAAYAGIAGNIASNMAASIRVDRNLCETEEKILLRILFPFLRVKWRSRQA